MSFARVAAGVLFVSLLLGIVACGHYYLAQRLIFDPGLTGLPRSLALGALGLGFVSIVLEPIVQRVLARPWSLFLVVPGALWMGIGFFFTVVLGAADFARWFVGSVAFAAGGVPPALANDAQALAVAATSVVGLATLLGVGDAIRGPRLVRREIPLAGWPRALDGFRIAQISDVHIGPILDRRFAASVTRRVNALDADLVAVTGDLVDGRADLVSAEVAPFGALRGRLGVFFVTGNHDHYSGAGDWVEVVAKLGMQVLRNRHVILERDGAAFVLAGVDDHRGGFDGNDREDLDAALAGVAPGLPIVLLAHDPSTFKRASRRGIALQLSGHTHGGQIWPFRYLVRLAIPFVAGRYARDGAQLYVSRGTGFWGPPMRLFAPAEITELTLRAA